MKVYYHEGGELVVNEVCELSLPSMMSFRTLLLPRRCHAMSRRCLSKAVSGAYEMGTVLDRYKPAESYVRGWISFSQSTLAVVNLREVR